MAKVNESKKKSLRIRVATGRGPCFIIPVTPKFIAYVCKAMDEAEYHSDGPMKEVTIALYNAIMENDEEEFEQDGQA